MIKPEIPENELSRLEALREYSILDTLPEKEYDDIAFLASHICQTPISLISLIDDKRQWFKSHHGLDTTHTPKEVAFCAHAINDQENIFIVPDSRKDKRFHDNPLVTDNPHVIFYVGIPLVNPEGYPLGTLCVIDNKPNKLNDDQIKALKALSDQLMKLFELRKNTIALHNTNYELKEQNKGLNEFARVAAHDIKSPMSNIVMLTELLQKKYRKNLDAEGIELLNDINHSTRQLTNLIDGILQYSKDTSLISKNRENINVKETIHDIIRLIDSNRKAKIDVNVREGFFLFTNKIAFEQIFVNLLSNGIKYNDKEQAEITIHIREEEEYIKVNIIDNGPGIKDEDKARIFNLFETTSNRDRAGFQGTGIGLATVKSLVEGLRGKIQVYSGEGEGANVEFTLKK